MGISFLNHPFGGTTILGNLHVEFILYYRFMMKWGMVYDCFTPDYAGMAEVILKATTWKHPWPTGHWLLSPYLEFKGIERSW